jgi:hypothetical protein
LVFNSCGKLPDKPEVENCIIISSLNLSACYNNQTGEERDIPLKDMNKFVCFSPEDWTETLSYIRLLERFKTTSSQAKRFIESYEYNKKRVDELSGIE